MANWYVRKGGSDSNGGSSASLTADRSGSDMGTTNASTTVTSVSASFTAGDVGKGINIAGNIYRIATYVNSTTITIDRTYSGTGTGRAWAIGGAVLTISKLISLTVTTAVQAGDIIQVGAGTYRELLAPGVAFSGSPVTVRGDTDGVATGDAGKVTVTAYLTNDSSAPSNTQTTLYLQAKSYWAFENIILVAGTNGSQRIINATAATNLTFTKCVFLSPATGTTSCIALSAAGANTNILFDKCRFLTFGPIFSQISLATHASADYDSNIVIRNCILQSIQSTGITVSATGVLSFKGGGVYIYNNLIIATGDAVAVNNANVSTTYPVMVENNILLPTTNAVDANVSGQIIENYNIISGVTTPRVNVTAGANSTTTMQILALNLGYADLWDGFAQPAYSTSANAPWVAYGSTSNRPTVDIMGKPRPAAAISTPGPFEPHNNWVKETTTVHSGAAGLSVSGPGNQDFVVSVTATTTAIKVWMRHNGQTTKPTFSVVNGSEAGVADASTTMTAAANTWEQLTLSIAPTSAGIVTVRLTSRDTGIAYADDFEVV